MKLSEEVLIEIIDIVRQGIAEGKDVSDLLRQMDLSIEPDSDLTEDEKISLSDHYLKSKGRF